MNEIISSSDAWVISEDLTDEEINSSGLRPTISARQVKALIEQLTGQSNSALQMPSLSRPSSREEELKDYRPIHTPPIHRA